MATSKHIDRICIGAVILALVISILFMNGQTLGIQVQAQKMGYEERLFDTSRVHTIDILIDDWDAFLTTAQSEEYSLCDVVIDGEAFQSVGIRGKGNTSLSTVASMDSDRYSFKLEFDQYDSTRSYYGLDKLSLNNLIQDNTMMKDYLTYQMMGKFSVAAPLCSYVYITVNGQDWGLYLAVEAVEESFLQRNYGSDYGQLYKPDSMNMGGGRGNGKDFSFQDFDLEDFAPQDTDTATQPTMPEGFGQMGSMMPGGNGQMGGMMPGGDDQMGGMMPGGDDQMGGMMPGGDGQMGGMMPGGDDQMGGMMPGGDDQMGGMMPGSDASKGTADVKLQYIDDQLSSYANIFSSAKTAVSTADQQRLVKSLRALSEGQNIDQVVAVEEVLRYFVVHNYVVNADSYTGTMVHNYYLYEKDGQLSMIPWDYNLAYGTFQASDANGMVNDDIDSPLSVTGADRPMIDWIMGSADYTQQYHTLFREFLDTVDPVAIIRQAETLIAPYVEKDPTKFCTSQEFETGVQTLSQFCQLRTQSVTSQLSGDAATVDASQLDLSTMGTMSHGKEGGTRPSGDSTTRPSPDMTDTGTEETTAPDGMDSIQPPAGMERPGNMAGMTGTRPDQGSFPDQGQQPTTDAPWLLLGITLLILAAGLLFAFKFKR